MRNVVSKIIFLLLAGLLFTSTAHSTNVELFAQLPAISDIAISPDGKHLAYITNQKDKSYLVITQWPPGRADAEPKFFGIAPGSSADWVSWANNEQQFVGLSRKTRARDGTPYTVTDIMTTSLKSKKPRILIQPERRGQFNSQVLNYLPRDPKHVLMMLNPDKMRNVEGHVPEVYKVDVVRGNIERVQTGEADIQQWLTDYTGAVRVGYGINLRDGSYHLKIRPRAIKEDPRPKWLTLKDLPGLSRETRIFGFGADLDNLLVGSRHETDTIALYTYDLNKRAFSKQLFHDKDVDVSRVRIDRAGNLTGAVVVKEEPETHYFTDKDLSPQRRVEKRLPTHQVRLIDRTSDGKEIIFRIGAPDDPGAILYYNTQSTKLSMISPLYPGLEGSALGMVIATKYSARDGTKLPAFVTLPPTITQTAQIKNLPFVILPHGGPHARDYKRFDFLAQYIASRGYGVLQMNFRGSTGYGKTFKEAGVGEWGTLMQDDIEDGVRWLVSKGYANPKKVCIVGGSYGGYAALMGIIRSPGLYACAVSLAGVTDLDNMIGDMRKYRGGKFSVAQFIGKLWTDPAARRLNSPMRRASEIKTPLLLVHGEDDQVVHFDHFTRMRRALANNPTPVSYQILKDGDHHLSTYTNRLAFLNRLGSFLDQYIGQNKSP
jgi:dipeptidyl aminopeptidase/acylaminoacyl peptidase